MLRESREFINRGNLVEIAVAFVLGTAFATVTTVFTGRVVSPLVALVADVGGLEDLWTFGPVDPATERARGVAGSPRPGRRQFRDRRSRHVPRREGVQRDEAAVRVAGSAGGGAGRAGGREAAAGDPGDLLRERA